MSWLSSDSRLWLIRHKDGTYYLQLSNMAVEDPKTRLQTTGQVKAIRAGGWILTLVVVGLWIGAGQLWKHDESNAPILEAQYSVEINQASERDLLNLPEVGPSLARKILSYRAQHGDFQSLSDFGEVPGVGPQTLKQLAPFLSFTHQSEMVGEDAANDTTEDNLLTAQSRERIAP